MKITVDDCLEPSRANSFLKEYVVAYARGVAEDNELRAIEHARRHLRPRLRWLVRYPGALRWAIRLKLWNPPPIICGGSVTYELTNQQEKT